MIKDQLLSLWNADNWEVMSCGVYFKLGGNELRGLLYDAPSGEGNAYQLQWLYRGRGSGNALLGAVDSRTG